MKIIYISNSIIPSRTANSIHVMKMCQAFTDNGHEVVLLTPHIKNMYEQNIEDIYEYYGVKNNFIIEKLYTSPIKGKIYIYSLSIWKFLKSNNADIVYGRFLYGCYISSLLGFKTIFEAHAPMWERKYFDKIIYKKMINNKNFNKLVVISNALKNMYIENNYIKNDKILVAHDGADEVKNLNLKIKLKGKEGSFKVGYVGHLYKGKGIEIIEKIANKVSDDIEFHIVGGLENDVKYWHSKIKSKNVYFYGFVQQKEVTKYINSLDVCLLPNQKIVLPYGAKDDSHNISTFTSPLKMFEYMSHNKLIISSNIPVLQEVLNKNNSILVSPSDIEEWISSLKLAKNDDLRIRLSSQAKEDFINFYTWKIRAKNVLC